MGTLRYLDLTDIGHIHQDFDGALQQQQDLVRGRAASAGGDYAPRTVGVLEVAPSLWKRLTIAAEGLASLYCSIAPQLLKILGSARSPAEWPFDRFSSLELSCLRQHATASALPALLRADVVVHRDRVCIVEVNSDNVGGFEDLLLRHAALETLLVTNKDERASSAYERITESHRGLMQSVRTWILAHYAACARQSSALPEKPRGAAVIALDTDVSYSTSSVYRHFLQHEMGLSAFCATPRDLRVEDNRFHLDDRVLQRSGPVDLVIRDWLFPEMFLADGHLVQGMTELLHGADQRQVCLLCPLSDRTFFSKAILAELSTGSRFVLSKSERTFIADFIPSTELASGATVLKPSSRSGGSGVVLVDDRVEIWIRQERIYGDTIPAHYRRELGAKPVLKDQNIVLGLFITVSPTGTGSLAGIVARIGPDPVVNVSRGADIAVAIPGPASLE